MRILQVIPFFTPKMGGSAQVAYQVARHLAVRGHEVTVITSDHEIWSSKFADGPFEVTFLRNLIHRWGFYVTPELIPWARRNLRKFDVIHLHEFRTLQNLIVRHYADRDRIPILLSAHGTLPIIVQRMLLKRAFDLLFGHRILASAQMLLAVSQVEADQFRQAGIPENRINVIYNGLDLDEFQWLPAPGSFRSRFPDLDQDTKIILYLGRLHKIKGIDHLIEAFARLNNENFDAILAIAGPDDGELANLIALTKHLGLDNRVHFIGPLYGRDKLAAYVDAAVLASPGVYEIFGLVPFEAIMAGTPVIVSEDCGSSELIRTSRAGYQVPYGDVPRLADTLLRALSSPGETRQQIVAGKRFIRENLDWEQIVYQLETAYATCVHPGHP